MRRLVVCVFSLAVAAPAWAASFDCGKASTAVEKLICADAEVSKLDERVAESYKKVSIADPAEWKTRQHKWLTNVRNRCADAACLKQAYAQRLAYLEEAAAAKITANPASLSFDKSPFVNPRIIRDLTTWESDHGDQIVAINLGDSQTSNRFFGDTLTKPGPAPKRPYVYFQSKSDESGPIDNEFGYAYVGQTASGIHVLHTKSWGGGSGVFEELLFVTIEPDVALSEPGSWKKTMLLRRERKRLLLRKLGSFGLGDRWNGKAEVKSGDLVLTDREGSRTVKVDPQL
jgi:uncharacterized protein